MPSRDERVMAAEPAGEPEWPENPARLALALYEPDIPQNTGTLLRLGACLGVPLHIVEPAGFVFSDRRLRRAGLDYLPRACRIHHEDWAAFRAWAHEEGRRIVLLTTRAGTAYTDLIYLKGDVLLLGRESAGVPEEVHRQADERVRIPVAPGCRSLNQAVAGAMVLGEALRQLAGFPKGPGGERDDDGHRLETG